MASLNQVQLIGNLGADPEVRDAGGNRVANLRIATSEQWKDKNSGQRKEKTDWHSVVVWGDGLVNVIENYLKKGSKVFISGKLQTRKWTDKDGNERYSTEVVLQGFDAKLVMLDGKTGSGEYQSAHNEAKQDGFQPQALNDEIPF